QNQILAIHRTSNRIFDLVQDEPVAYLSGDGTKPLKETFRKFVEDTTAEFYLNYNVHDAAPILNGSHLAIIYDYNEKLMLEIKDQQLKTIYTNDFTHIPGFQRFYDKKYARTSGYYFIIQDDTIYFMALENEEYKLYPQTLAHMIRDGFSVHGRHVIWNKH
ncbi:MAG: hypothetical protein JKY80_01050, partial [Mariprofundaceae bacterium]|nr:hypothetical protein [Mariprofundaceae bacterium]